jgi:hypothetical protein
MTERHPVRGVRIVMRLDALDAAAQSRKRVRACAAHAPLLKIGPSLDSEREPETGSIVHDMF